MACVPVERLVGRAGGTRLSLVEVVEDVEEEWVLWGMVEYVLVDTTTVEWMVTVTTEICAPGDESIS